MMQFHHGRWFGISIFFLGGRKPTYLGLLLIGGKKPTYFSSQIVSTRKGHLIPRSGAVVFSIPSFFPLKNLFPRIINAEVVDL